MDKQKLIERFKALEQQIAEQLEKIDTTRRSLLHLIENELHNREHIKAHAQTLREDLFYLRELCQQIIFSGTLLTKAEGANND